MLNPSQPQSHLAHDMPKQKLLGLLIRKATLSIVMESPDSMQLN